GSCKEFLIRSDAPLSLVQWSNEVSVRHSWYDSVQYGTAKPVFSGAVVRHFKTRAGDAVLSSRTRNRGRSLFIPWLHRRPVLSNCDSFALRISERDNPAAP